MKRCLMPQALYDQGERHLFFAAGTYKQSGRSRHTALPHPSDTRQTVNSP